LRSRLSLNQKPSMRLRADRDIRPEATAGTAVVLADGTNATALVDSYVNGNRGSHRDLVEKKMIHDLNEIVQPDCSFTRILLTREGANLGPWELQLEDVAENRIPISQSGSGLKTILLTLICYHLVPHAKQQREDRSNYLFCFEELENNLHPAVQRRLFGFLRKRAVEEGFKVFVTTHSSAVIDLFGNDSEAQILHVTNDGTKALVRTISSYLHKCHVLDDLDVRASDLLQANALVWVEGPSDVLYFNRWIELWTDGALQEKVHYQCVWYGGALLADMGFHLQDDGASDELLAEKAAADERADALVNALRVNRHAIVLMDSDRRSESDLLKERVERIRREVTQAHGEAWITAGREVENYIPIETLRLVLKNPNLAQPEKLADIFEYVNRPSWKGNKVALAHKIVPMLRKAELEKTLDLAPMLDLVCGRIREWNGIRKQ